MQAPIRTLLFSTLYPSSVRPTHGIFVETRLRELLKSGEVDAKVLAPVPWFPSTHPRYGAWAKMAQIPKREQHNGVDIFHPRYLLPPKVGMNVAPMLLALGARATIKNLLRQGWDFDLIDAHYYYPDGVAAALLAKWFNKPFVITARGTDLNVIPQFPLPRRMICWTASRAAASIGVCKALMDKLGELGANPAKFHVMRNGVDLQRFTPLDPTQARQNLELPAEICLVSVGHLVELKGHHIAIDALRYIPNAFLVIVGEGPERERLMQQARESKVENRVRFTGSVPNAELKTYYSAADVLILASSREGWANVLLESMACGTPVVATNICGTPEVVQSSEAGRLVDKRDGKAFADAIIELINHYPARAQVRQYAETFSWDATTEAQLNLFKNVMAKSNA